MSKTQTTIMKSHSRKTYLQIAQAALKKANSRALVLAKVSMKSYIKHAMDHAEYQFSLEDVKDAEDTVQYEKIRKGTK